jgi:guanylate kinase
MVHKEVYKGGDMSSREDQAVDQHRVRLDQLQARWDSALRDIAPTFGIDAAEMTTGELMKELERVSCGNFLSNPERIPGAAMVIGCAGPGASGKGTLDKRMVQGHGYSKVVNTTTRPMRNYEQQDVQYHFIDEEEYQRRLDAGMFLGANDKPGRGRYGIGKADLQAGVASGGCLLEENPFNLLGILQQQSAETPVLMLYILSPDPIMDTLACCLYIRSNEKEESKRELTEADVESTLGDRQIDEFGMLARHEEFPDVPVVFLVNDVLEESFQKIDALLS